MECRRLGAKRFPRYQTHKESKTLIKFLIAIGLLLCTHVAIADDLTLNNGDKLTGKVVTLVDGKLTFNSALAGVVSVNVKDVKSLTTDKPQLLFLNDGNPVTEKLGEKRTLADIQAINPPAPPAIKWHGNASLGLGTVQGNINSNNFSLLGSASRDSGDSLLAFDGGWLINQQAKKTTDDTIFENGEYDFNRKRKLFGFVNENLRRDRIQRLNLRTILGTGLGYIWVKNPTTTFVTKVGISWKNDQYSGQRSRSNFAGQLGYNLDTHLGKSLHFFHDFTYLPSFSGGGDYYFITQAGIEQNLSSSISLDLRYILDYTARPAAGSVHSTAKLLLGIGKKF